MAIFFPFMTLSDSQVKRYLLITAALFMVPLTIALAINFFGWIVVYYVDVILLQHGVLSIIFVVGYGIIAGLLLYCFKTALFFIFRGIKSVETFQEQQEK